MIRVGTSGWQYGDWRGSFYPPDLQTPRWLEYFSRHFSTVEVNNTFYRLPAHETFVRWRQLSPPGFFLAVKASRYITHVRRLRDCSDPLRLFWSRAQALGDRLGPVLFQLPPSFSYDLARLEAFLRLLPRGLRAAFEFRHRSWEREETYAVLEGAGAALVWADRPRARVPRAVCSGWAYVRFHQGRNTAPGYTRAKLRRWADRLAGLTLREVWVYFNNDTGAAAVRDARTLIDLLRERGCEVA